MKKKLIVLSLFLIGMTILLISTSTNANAGVEFIKGRWSKNIFGHIDGCKINGDECGITILRPI